MPLVYSAQLLLKLLAQDFRSYTTFAVPLCGPTAVVPPAFMSFILLLQRPGAVSRHSNCPRAPSKHYFRADPSVSGLGEGLVFTLP